MDLMQVFLVRIDSGILMSFVIGSLMRAGAGIGKRPVRRSITYHVSGSVPRALMGISKRVAMKSLMGIVVGVEK
jgi:hypothetical protein